MLKIIKKKKKRERDRKNFSANKNFNDFTCPSFILVYGRDDRISHLRKMKQLNLYNLTLFYYQGLVPR